MEEDHKMNTRRIIALYITLRDYEQFTPYTVLNEISALTGIEYTAGHLISAIINDLEQVLLGND